LPPSAELGIQGAKAVVAVSLKWAHAQRLSEGKGLSVVAGGGINR
jgi:hypothetical protein